MLAGFTKDISGRRRIRRALLLALILSAMIPTVLYAATIQSLHGQRRIVLFSAPNGRDGSFIGQHIELARWQGAADRDVVEVRIAGNSVSGVDDSAVDLRQRYHLPNDRFAVVLIGKDGHVALSSAMVLTIEQLQSAIDAMPMRRAGER